MQQAKLLSGLRAALPAPEGWARRTLRTRSSSLAPSASVTQAPKDTHLHYEEIAFPPKVPRVDCAITAPSEIASLLQRNLDAHWAEASVEPPRTAVIVHGLLGSGRNWRSFSRALGAAVLNASEAASDCRGWRFLLVDQRNHGQSTLRNHDGPHTIQASASDINTLLKGRAPDVLIGHSLGGKVALEYLRLMQELALAPPHCTWVLDSMPGIVDGDPHNAKETIATLKKLPQSVPSRKWLADYMQQRGYPKMVIDWVGTNLVEAPGSKPGEGPLVWAFDVDGCAQMYESYASNCMWDVLEAPPQSARIELVRAEKCLPWPEQMETQVDKVLTRGDEVSVGVHTLEKAGHWLQMDNPTGLVKLVAPSFAM